MNATAVKKQRDRNGRKLAKKLAEFLRESPHPNEIRVMPVMRCGTADVLRERMETRDGAELVGHSTLVAFKNRGWMLVRKKGQKMGLIYTLTHAGAKALAESAKCG